MAIIVERIIEPTANGARAIVDHCGEKLAVEIVASAARLPEVLGRQLDVEVGFSRVINFRVASGAELTHGLFSGDEPDRVRIVGSIHNVLSIDSATSLFDIYIRTGPEFVTFDSNDLAGLRPELNDQIEAMVQGLCFYPTWT